MKYIQFILSALFFFFAALQFNDPDPVGWVLVYSFTGIACLMGAMGRTGLYFRPVIYTGLAITFIWAISLTPEFINWIQAGAPNIFSTWQEGTIMTEMVREFLGLSLCALVMLFQVSTVSNQTDRRLSDKYSTEQKIAYARSK